MTTVEYTINKWYKYLWEDKEMKYKVGDKVIVKTKQEIIKIIDEKYDFENSSMISDIMTREKVREAHIEVLSRKNTLTIRRVYDGFYLMEMFGTCWRWYEDMISHSLSERWVPINSRFEILDL